MGSRYIKCVIILAIISLLGLAILGTGIGLFYEFPVIIKNKIKQNVPLTEGTASFTQWKSPPVPVYMQFWVWDLKNKDDVIKNGSKPIIQQIGPFTYREKRVKENITFHDKNSTLSYSEPKQYIFEPGMSAGLLENETFVSINLPLIVIAKMFPNSGFLEKLIQVILSRYHDSLYKEYSVYEYLWGFSDPVIEAVNGLLSELHLPLIPDKFGLFVPPNGNGSSDGIYKIYTGKDQVSKVNIIETWKNMSHLNFWQKNYTNCNMINGTDGTLFPPFVTKNEIKRFFSSDICRSIYATFVKEYSLQGINLYRFVPPKDVFEDPRINPANRGFCTTQCFKAGVLDVSVCKDGAPIMMSQPHFYQADPEYINATIGVDPVKSEHQTVLDIEPMTGAVMNVAKRLQINAYLKPTPYLVDTKTLKNPIIFPLVWLNESATIDKASADKFKAEVLQQIWITTIVQYAVIGVGALIILVCLIVAAVMVVKNWWSRQLTPGDGKSGLISTDDHEE